MSVSAGVWNCRIVNTPGAEVKGVIFTAGYDKSAHMQAASVKGYRNEITALNIKTDTVYTACTQVNTAYVQRAITSVVLKEP